jgi:hypothetical protein
MTSGHCFTRRNWIRLCAGWVVSRRLVRAEKGSVLGWVSQAGPETGQRRRYRADAQIILLSIPMLHRKGVGDGAAVWRDSSTEDGVAERFLEFIGRSEPERAAGLNRFGFIQELSRAKDSREVESRYFGLMTSSPEESAADARKALQPQAGDVPFSAIEGRLAAGRVETVSARFLAPARTAASDRRALIERARAALSDAPAKRREAPAGGGVPRPFLHVLAGVLTSPEITEGQYVYNGRLYRMRVDRSPDAKAAHAFRALGLIAATATVTRIAGTVRREDGGKASDFRLWIEDGAPRPIPLRIEYQPKSYLRLTFEAEV